MCADQTPRSGPRKSVVSNADFSVFSCQKKGHKVFLDLHTEYFCFNVNNTASGANTPKFLNAIYNSLPPTNKHPRKLWLTAEAHEHVIYMTVRNGHYAFDEEGTKIEVGDSVMGGNYIHGIINTAGCWMLLRNYNWPACKRDDFLSIYIHDWRDGGATEDEMVAKLSVRQYNRASDDLQRSSSFRKWLRWDKNYAYNFFFNRLVGVDFFAKVEVDMNYSPNLHNTHGQVQNPNSFADDEKSFEKAFSNPPEAEEKKIHHKKSANVDNSMWRDTSVRGAPTAHGWGKVFADCYIFNPDNRSLTELKGDPYVPPPAPVPLPPRS